MSYTKLCTVLTVGIVVGSITSSAQAGIFRHGRSGGYGAPACGAPVRATPCGAIGGHYEERVVERVICVPETQTEMRTVAYCVMKPEVRERDVTVVKRVPYTETMTQEYTVMVQKTEMRRHTQTVYRPVTKQVEQTYTVMVPYQEVREGVRHVPQCEPVTIAKNVCVDRGHWETREVMVPCRSYGYGYGYQYGCAPCPPPMIKQCVRVWVPNYVTEQVTRTVLQTRMVPQHFTYNVTLCRPEQRTRTVNVCETVAEQVTKDVPVTICVPEKRTRTYDVTKYKCVEETQKQSYTVMVPHREEKQVPVQVCKMVQKTVSQTVKVWVPDCTPAATGCATPASPGCTTPAAAAPTPAPTTF